MILLNIEFLNKKKAEFNKLKKSQLVDIITGLWADNLELSHELINARSKLSKRFRKSDGAFTRKEFSWKLYQTLTNYKLIDIWPAYWVFNIDYGMWDHKIDFKGTKKQLYELFNNIPKKELTQGRWAIIIKTFFTCNGKELKNPREEYNKQRNLEPTDIIFQVIARIEN